MSSFIRFLHICLCFIMINHFQNSLCLSEEMQELADMLHKTCQDETGALEEHIINVRKGDFAEDNKLKCYMFCVMAQMAVVEDDGTIDEDGMIAVMPDEFKDKAEKVIRGCGTKSGADPCDTVFQTNKCYYASAPDNYFMP